MVHCGLFGLIIEHDEPYLCNNLFIFEISFDFEHAKFQNRTAKTKQLPMQHYNPLFVPHLFFSRG